ncbi:unnamed protein product [Paramecium sonneborni]|uniref:Uncharacterized protein n=1 Tax=Paramecium sonneborni TaxID=65129 RepID=A0A8S1QSZ7_9CILI|nr:unnamed protein product [Paramecium sonneborni]
MLDMTIILRWHTNKRNLISQLKTSKNLLLIFQNEKISNSKINKPQQLNNNLLYKLNFNQNNTVLTLYLWQRNKKLMKSLYKKKILKQHNKSYPNQKKRIMIQEHKFYNDMLIMLKISQAFLDQQFGCEKLSSEFNNIYGYIIKQIIIGKVSICRAILKRFIDQIRILSKRE